MFRTGKSDALRTRPVEETYSEGSRWFTWLLEDQRFVQQWPDTLSWETEPLTENVTVAGDIVAHLFASTRERTADWIVKSIDMYPERYEPERKMGGHELMIADEVFRGRFRRVSRSRSDCGGGSDSVYDRSAYERPCVSERAPDYGAGAKYVVSGDRPESAEVCAEYF